MIENYIYKKESNIDTFFYDNKKICLREYQKNLLFYWSGEEEKAEYALFDKTPSFEISPTVYNGGKFGSYSKISSPISFNGKNLQSLTDNISLSFWLSSNNMNGNYTIFLTKKGEWEKLSAGDYSFVLQLDGEISRTVKFSLKEGSTFTTLKNKLTFILDPNLYNVEVDADQTTENSIALTSTIKGKEIRITNGTDGTDLLSLIDVSSKVFGNLPTKDIDIISLISENSKLKITHSAVSEETRKVSKLKFVYGNNELEKTTSIEWNNDGHNFDHIEVDIDSSVMYVFLNGELLKTVLISPIVRTGLEETVLTISGDEENIYSIEELIIKSKLQNKENFNPPISQLTKYDTTIPYIDFYYSGDKVFKNSLNSLVSECSDNISFVLNYDGKFYYYGAGAWRNSDGSFSKSNDSYTFADYINEFDFTSKDDIFIRAYFESDGDTPAWIQDLYFTINDNSIYGDEKATAAILVGEREFAEDEIVEVEGKD